MLAFNAELASEGQGRAALEGRLPLVVQSTGLPGFARNGVLNGSLHAAGRAGPLWSLLPVDVQRLDGDADLTVTASGTWRAPRLNGSLKLANGLYEDLATGTHLAALDLAIEANNEAARMTLTAGDGAQGRVTGQGDIVFAAEQHFPVRGELKVTHFRIVDFDDVRAQASGQATLSGPFAHPKFQGALSFERVDARIPDRLPPSVPMLPVSYVGAEGEIIQASEPKSEPGPAIALDFALDIPGRAYLRGRGLNAEWAGKLALGGTTTAPSITGEIGLVRGTLDFAGNAYELSRGRVTFQGGPKINPELDVAATRSVQGNDVSLAVIGRVSAPKLEIQSVPALPQDQAVAYLLFGKPAGALSAFELVQVAQGVATLARAGGGGGLGVVGRARQALGLDVLSVGVGQMGATSISSASALAQGATVSAGRHISNKVYIGVTQGASAATGSVKLDIQLTPHVSVNTELGQASGGTAGLDWKFDY